MTWLEDVKLRDLDDAVLIETVCLRCCYTWLQSPIELLLKVDHRDVRLDEVARNLACAKSGCRHVGVRLTLVQNKDSSGFVGGMP